MLAPVVDTEGKIAEANDRRHGRSRQRLLMRVAKLRCTSGEYPCILLDVSESGAKLRLFHGHPPDTHMFLELANGEFFAIERRWLAGDTAGFRFSSAVEVQDFVQEAHPRGRRPVRLRTGHEVRISSGGEGGHAVLVNLSAGGACIEAGRQLAVGSLLRIEFAGRDPRFAHVCWRSDYRHGLAFQDSLSLAAFARLALDLQPYEAVAAAPLTGEARALYA